MAKQIMPCGILSCDEPAYCCGLCKGCYQSTWYASKRGVKWQMHRRSRIKVFEERLDSIRPSNVSILRRRRA